MADAIRRFFMRSACVVFAGCMVADTAWFWRLGLHSGAGAGSWHLGQLVPFVFALYSKPKITRGGSFFENTKSGEA